jgi:hypothetical protein
MSLSSLQYRPTSPEGLYTFLQLVRICPARFPPRSTAGHPATASGPQDLVLGQAQRAKRRTPSQRAGCPARQSGVVALATSLGILLAVDLSIVLAGAVALFVQDLALVPRLRGGDVLTRPGEGPWLTLWYLEGLKVVEYDQGGRGRVWADDNADVRPALWPLVQPLRAGRDLAGVYADAGCTHGANLRGRGGNVRQGHIPSWCRSHHKQRASTSRSSESHIDSRARHVTRARFTPEEDKCLKELKGQNLS